MTSPTKTSMLVLQTERQIPQRIEPSAILSLSIEILLLFVIYSIGALVAESWIVMIWAGRTIARVVTHDRNLT